MNDQIKIRPATQDDVKFIFNSWLKSYKHSKFAKPIISTIYFTEHHRIIESMLKNYETLVACNADDPDQIYGFANGDLIQGVFCINYVYVKQSFRNFKICTKLLLALGYDSTKASVRSHETRISEKITDGKDFFKKNMYHPYIMLNPGDSSDSEEN